MTEKRVFTRDWLIYARKKKHISQQQMAKMLFMVDNTYRFYEKSLDRAPTKITLEIACRLAEILGLTLDQIAYLELGIEMKAQGNG